MTTTPETICRCHHSAARHEALCRACGCKRFTPRPAPWLVRREDINAVTMPITGPWRVISPRGVEVFTTHSQRSAAQLAASLAGVDELLARVNRLEGSVFGHHPALSTSARRSSPRRSRVSPAMSGNPGAGRDTTSEVLAFITAYVDSRGYSPALREIGAAVGLKSSNTCKFHVDKLVNAGLLERETGQPRTLRPTAKARKPRLA